MRLFHLFLFLVAGFSAFSQNCPNPGQNPLTAFPVCGTSVFTQNSVPTCSGTLLPSPPCRKDDVADVNPYWYKFTCFTAGTLGFLITPKDLNDDYDWEVYDITGKNPNNVYTDGRLLISCNWSGESGLTGASSAGNNLFLCEGPGIPLFSKMPSLIQGHNYLLMVSHFTNSQSGYDLEFKGGSAVITDPAPPGLRKADANCGADKIRVSLSKKMRCSSVAADGSDFQLAPASASVIGAVAFNCGSGFDSDSIELTLSGKLPPGNYTVITTKGSDGNTIIDNCNVGIAENTALSLVILPKTFTPLDSIVPVKCSPNELRLVFKKPMLCATIAADGTDFMVNGNYPVSVVSAAGTCNNGLSSQIIIKLDKPMQQAGTFVLELKSGTDGNTIKDECNEETPAGSALFFSVKDTVNADFIPVIRYGCQEDTVDYIHPGGNGVNNWQWDLAENLKANTQNAIARYKVFNTKNVQLIVDNGFCIDTSTQRVLLENYLEAGFTVEEDLCPLEPVTFVNNSKGKIAAHKWLFGDGDSAFTASPIYSFDRPASPKSYKVVYTATDIWGCTQTTSKGVKVYPSCIIDVPNGFTPNGDNINDIFYPLNAVKARQLEFKVYNRWGVLIFSTDNWKRGWDGRYKDLIQPGGIYVWTLRYTHGDTGKQVQRKGTVVLTN
ncbi:MAG: gliding motility-associated C-terminal domain-containing protein [Chitinophagaceae bacterium]|nr:gliding motility-associated C-terminal domain-containing protein [Chitinophagaceae bacterium]